MSCARHTTNDPSIHHPSPTMPPRKSISRARPSRAVDEPVEAPRSTDAVEPSSSSHAQQQSQPQPTASTSKVTLDMPPIDVPEDIVWEYEAAPKEPQVLTEEDKERIVHEVSLDVGPWSPMFWSAASRSTSRYTAAGHDQNRTGPNPPASLLLTF